MIGESFRTIPNPLPPFTLPEFRRAPWPSRAGSTGHMEQ